MCSVHFRTMLNRSQQCTLVVLKTGPILSCTARNSQQLIRRDYSPLFIWNCIWDPLIVEEGCQQIRAQQRMDKMVREGKEPDKIQGEGKEMGVCAPWRGDGPCGNLTAHFHCQQGAYRGKRPLYKLQDEELPLGRRRHSSILCYLPLTDCFIGEMRGTEMFNPGNTIFLSTECPSKNERRKKKPEKLPEHGPQVCDYHGMRKEPVPHFWA